jgi:xyloglucan-specific exo-beta-1,4-glucanase
MKKVLSILTAAALISTSLMTLPVSAASTAASGNSFTTQEYTYKNVAIGGGGYVDNIIFNPGEKNLIYARTDMGGAYRWDEDTQSWTCLTDWIDQDNCMLNGCDSLACDPVDTNRVYIQAGEYTQIWGKNGAIFRSEDKGNTWEVVNLPFKVGANNSGRHFGERLAVDPNSNNVIYMGTRGGNGIWKSTDYGKTWSQIESFTATGDYNPGDYESYDPQEANTGVVWVTPDPSSSKKGTPCQIIYAGVCNNVGEESIFVTRDGGETWSALEGQPTYALVRNDTTRELPLLPAHGVLSSKGMLYIVYTDSVNEYDEEKGDIWRYNTKTGEWKQISPVPSSSSDDYFGYGGISIDAQNPDTLVVSTDEQWWPDANMYRSTDGGETWTPFWEWNGYPSRKTRFKMDISFAPWLENDDVVEPDAPIKIGHMIGNVSIDPFNSDRMMYGTGATVFGTNNLTDMDKGETITISCMVKGIEQTVAPVLISPESGDVHLISGLYDVCGYVHKDLDSVPAAQMDTPKFSSTVSMDYAEENQRKFVRVGSYSNACSSPRIGISWDQGEDWYTVNNCWDSSSTDSTGGGSVAMSADGDTIVWAPDNPSIAVHYSTDTGSSWTECSGVPAQSKVFSDRVNSSKFYAYKDGTFYISTDGGKTFTETVTGLPYNANLKVMTGIEGDIWLAGTSDNSEESAHGLWHSTDSGKTFTRLSTVDVAETVGFGKAADGADYMAIYITGKIDGVRGFFRSDDEGQSWVRINDDNHQYGTSNSSITGDPQIYGRVYIGTNGRGIVYGDIAGSSTSSSTISNSTASFDINNPSDVSVDMTLNGNTLDGIYNGDTALTEDTDYTVSGSTVTIFSSYLAKQPTGTVSLKFDFSAGIDRTLTIKISDTTIASLSEATASTTAGTAPTLPSEITATYNDGTTADVAVTWDEIDPSSYAGEGTFTVYGTVEGTTLKVTCTVTVKALPTISSIEDTTATTTVGIAPTLPSTVIATYTDGTTADVTVTWDEIDESSYAEEGTFTVYGTVEGTTLKASCTVTVKALPTISSIEDTTATTTVGIAPTLPSTVIATYTDGTTADVAVTWDEIDESSYAEEGTFTVYGAVEGTTLKASCTVTVNEKPVVVTGNLEVQEFNFNTAASTNGITSHFKLINNGTTAIDLSKITLRYYFTKDNTQSQTFWCDWSNVDSSNVTSTFVSLDSAVDGADTYLQIGFTSEAGTLAPGAYVEIMGRFSNNDWSNFTQTNDYSFNSTDTSYADWTKVTAYDDGTLIWGVEPAGSGSSTPEPTPTPATISSLADAAVSTIAGTAPTLPSTVKATYSDGTVKNVAVTWDEIDESSYAEAGTFTVSGTVADTSLKASCSVTVKEAAEVTGDLTVQMFNGNTQATTNGIAPRFKLTNTGSSSIDLSKITLRYYYTEDGAQSQSFWCDWSSVGSGNVVGTFNDGYLEISFASDAGTLAPGAAAEIQARFAKNDWSNYNQADDYSFNSSAASYTDWTKVTAYNDGLLIYGVEP